GSKDWDAMSPHYADFRSQFDVLLAAERIEAPHAKESDGPHAGNRVEAGRNEGRVARDQARDGVRAHALAGREDDRMRARSFPFVGERESEQRQVPGAA